MAALTSRLTDLFRRMRPQKPVQVSVDEAQNVATSLERLAEGEVIDAVPRQAREGLLAKLPGARRDAAIRQLQSDYREVIDLIRTVRGHLDQQAGRSDRLLQLLERLPEAIAAIPESNRNQSRMLEAMHTHFEQQGRASLRLNEALGNLAASAEHQAQVLTVIQTQLDARSETDQQLAGTFGAMNQTLAQLGESSAASAAAIRATTQRADDADRRIEQMMLRTSRQMTTLMVIGWVIAGLAMIIALWALLKP